MNSNVEVKKNIKKKRTKKKTKSVVKGNDIPRGLILKKNINIAS